MTKYCGVLPSFSKKHLVIFNHPREKLWKFGWSSHLIGRRIRGGYTYVHILCAHHSSEEKAASRKIFPRSSLSLDFRSRPPVKKAKASVLFCCISFSCSALFFSLRRFQWRELWKDMTGAWAGSFWSGWPSKKKRVPRKSISSSRSGGYYCSLDRIVHAFLVAKKQCVFLGQCLTLASARCTSQDVFFAESAPAAASLAGVHGGDRVRQLHWQAGGGITVHCSR